MTVVPGGGLPQGNGGKDFTDREGPLFSIQAFRGFRAWYVPQPIYSETSALAGQLKSITYDFYWKAGVNMSTCLARRLSIDHTSHDGAHKAECYRLCQYPTKDCTCGFYAYFKEGYFLSTPSAKALMVHGVVDAYGRVVKGAKGFRAQTSVIVGLALPEAVPEAIQKRFDMTPDQLQAAVQVSLAAVYPGVPIFKTVADLLAAMPPTEI